MTQTAVWIVEDDVAVRESMELLLKQRGVRVLSHASASQLLRERNLDSCACLVVDDQNSELSGIELLEVLRSRRIATPALLMSTDTSPRLAHRAARVGAIMLHKPVSAGELLNALRRTAPEARL